MPRKPVAFLVMPFALAAPIACQPAPSPPPPHELSADDRQEVVQAVRVAKRDLPSPQAWEVSALDVDHDSDPLVVTIQVKENGVFTGPLAMRFGRAVVLAVRNALHGAPAFDNYRVTLNGPEPGPGLVLRYGSARMADTGEGGIRMGGWKVGRRPTPSNVGPPYRPSESLTGRWIPTLLRE